MDKLSKESQSIRAALRQEWSLTRLEQQYLRQALAYNDQANDCETEAKNEGLSLTDMAGRKYLNPLLTQAKIARNNYLRLMKLIGFEKVLKEKAKRRVGRPTQTETQRRQDDADEN